jgi:integrase/recombinase XerD
MGPSATYESGHFYFAQTGHSHFAATQVTAYLDGSRMSAYTWWREYQIIRSFFQFWQSRNKLARLPMPRPQSALPPPFRPYIFSRTELLRLLMAIERTALLDPMTMRTFFLFLYGTGARVHEAIGLRISDIDFKHSLLSLLISLD